MTTSSNPLIQWDDAWHKHRMEVAAVGEISEQANQQMQKLISSLRAYRSHKTRCTTTTEVDYALVTELTVEINRVIHTP